MNLFQFGILDLAANSECSIICVCFCKDLSEHICNLVGLLFGELQFFTKGLSGSGWYRWGPSPWVALVVGVLGRVATWVHARAGMRTMPVLDERGDPWVQRIKTN